MAQSEISRRTLDDVAALAVTLRAADLQSLAQIQCFLKELADANDWPEQACAQVEVAVAASNAIILDEAGDPEACVIQIGTAIENIQQILDVVERGEDVETTTTAGAQPGDAARVETDLTEDPAPFREAAEPAPAGANMLLDADPGLLGEFITEAMDHISASEASLLALEADPQDTEAVNAVFRAFHTIKGTAGFIGLTQIQELAHRAEALLDRARDGEIRLTGGYADLALEAADTLKQMIEALQDGLGGSSSQEPPNLSDLTARLTAPEAAGISADSSPEGPVAPRVGDLLVAENRADREDVEVAACDQGDTPIGETLVRFGAASARDVAKALRTQKHMSGASDATVRISTERLDNLINMVGELVIAQSMVSQNAMVMAQHDRELQVRVADVSKITRELQSVSLSMRMVPLRATFQKMARMVRDLARKSGKSVDFIVEGEDTEIDRNMVESLSDPLIHMIRNAVDHGIETPEERQKASKPACGTIALRAYHAAENVVIELEDDGKGLDRNVLAAKAVEKGIIEPDRELTDSEAYKLVLAPGFSTATRVTDVSGRGVGMDVVRRNIEALRGKIDIASEPGKGSNFTLRVPLTLAIIDGMLVRVGEERYVLPTIRIQQAFRMDECTIHTVTGKGEMVLLRGGMIPVFRLSRLFGGQSNHAADTQDALFVVAESDDQRCALLVDELLGQQQVVVKSLGEAMGHVKGISGAAILGDGRVGLILDVQEILTITNEASKTETYEVTTQEGA